jgi:hypothetical protein
VLRLAEVNELASLTTHANWIDALKHEKERANLALPAYAFQNLVNIHLSANALPIIVPNHHQDACYLSICVSSTGQALPAIRYPTSRCEACIIGLGKLLLWVEVGLLSVSQGYTQLYFCSTRHNGQ